MFCIGVEHLAVLKTLPLKCSVRGVDGGQLRLPCSICSQISEPSSLHYHLRAQNIPPPENQATRFSFQEYIGSVILRKLFRQVITNSNLETRSTRPTHSPVRQLSDFFDKFERSEGHFERSEWGGLTKNLIDTGLFLCSCFEN